MAAIRFSTLGRLVRTIVPRAQVIAIYDGRGQVGWASDTAEHAELDALAAELLAGASADGGGHSHSMRCELDSEASYAFLMRDPAGAAAGVVALTVAGPFRRADLLRPAALRSRLAPLLAVGAQAEPDSIERLIAVLAARLEAEAVIASVPAGEFERSYRQPDSQLPDLATLRRLVDEEIAPRAGSGAEPLRIDKARIVSGSPVFGFVCAPLRHRNGAAGALAVFATQARRPFSIQDAEQVTRGAERLAELLR